MIGDVRLRYVRRATPLHAARAGVAATWTAALALVALSLSHPLALAVLACALLAAGGAARCLAPMLRTLAWTGPPVILLSVAVNALVDHDGLTVLARLGDWGPFGQVDPTLEGVVYGLVMALRIVIVMLAGVLALCAVDADELLRAARGRLRRSALTATLSTRLIPLLLADARRLADARSGAGRLLVLRATVGGSLDRAIDVAAALETRGFGAGPRVTRMRRPWSRHDLAFAAAALLLGALAVVVLATGAGTFTPYPLLHMPLTGGLGAICSAVVVAVLAPFADRRGVRS